MVSERRRCDLVELRFANKLIQIGGKPSIVVGPLDKLIPILQTVRKAVMAGELDVALRAAADICGNEQSSPILTT